MHELSIAQSIVEIVRNTVPTEHLQRVLKIQMQVGAMAGVVTDSLIFSFQAITDGTPLGHAQLVVETIPFRIRCTSCGEISIMDDGIMQCPVCQSMKTEVVSGNELYVMAIEMIDDDRSI